MAAHDEARIEPELPVVSSEAIARELDVDGQREHAV